MTNKVIPVIHVKDNNIISIKILKAKINKTNIKTAWQGEKRNCGLYLVFINMAIKYTLKLEKSKKTY